MALFVCLILAMYFVLAAFGPTPGHVLNTIFMCIMAGIFGWLGFFMFLDQLRDYRRIRRDEKIDQHDWPFRYNGTQL